MITISEIEKPGLQADTVGSRCNAGKHTYQCRALHQAHSPTSIPQALVEKKSIIFTYTVSIVACHSLVFPSLLFERLCDDNKSYYIRNSKE